MPWLYLTVPVSDLKAKFWSCFESFFLVVFRYSEPGKAELYCLVLAWDSINSVEILLRCVQWLDWWRILKLFKEVTHTRRACLCRSLCKFPSECAKASDGDWKVCSSAPTHTFSFLHFWRSAWDFYCVRFRMDEAEFSFGFMQFCVRIFCHPQQGSHLASLCANMSKVTAQKYMAQGGKTHELPPHQWLGESQASSMCYYPPPSGIPKFSLGDLAKEPSMAKHHSL